VSAVVVIPVRDGGADVERCLATVLPEAAADGVEVIVVDDASRDRSAERAEAAGAQVLRLDVPHGPYAARNAGWRASDAQTVVFTDVRNRADVGWLRGLLAPLADPSVAVAGGRVFINGDGRIAHRLARRHSHVDPEQFLADEFLPFVTTSSMAIRRTALETVGGFAEVRSGADADLCWRVQLAGIGSVVLAPDSVMACEPRDGVVDIWQQWRRYAGAYADLRARYAPRGAHLRRTSSIRGHLHDMGERVRTDPDRDLALEAVDLVRWITYELAYRRALKRRTGAEPAG
jgi:cellulose synthase/poly-beta-1,6-N-acetylglucosamine synthase-like glycosyltransferase